MKILSRCFGLVLASLALVTAARAEAPLAGYVEFGKFVPSTSADQFVEVNLKGNLLKLAAQFTKKDQPEIAELLSNIHQVRVNVVGIGDDNRADVTKRLSSIRTDLESKGWDRIVSAREKTQDVAVYLKTGEAEVVEGVVVTVIEGGKEAVFVNIVGKIKLDDIAKVAESLDIEPLKKVKGAMRTKKPTHEEGKK